MSGLFLDTVAGGRSRGGVMAADHLGGRASGRRQQGGAAWTGSVQAAYPGTRGTDAGASPQGPLIAGKGFGTFDGSEELSPVPRGVLTVGTLAFFGLVALWCSLPR